MSPEEAEVAYEEEREKHARRRGGGRVKKPKDGVRGFGHGERASAKRRAVDTGRAQEARVEERELLLTRHLGKVITDGKKAELYAAWLSDILDGGSPFRVNDVNVTEGETRRPSEEVEGRITRLQRHSKGGQKQQRHGTSYEATHVTTGITIVESEGRGGPEVKREKALRRLEDAVRGLAEEWRKYAQDAGQAAMSAREVGEPVAEPFENARDSEEAGKIAAFELFREVTGFEVT